MDFHRIFPTTIYSRSSTSPTIIFHWCLGFKDKMKADNPASVTMLEFKNVYKQGKGANGEVVGENRNLGENRGAMKVEG